MKSWDEIEHLRQLSSKEEIKRDFAYIIISWWGSEFISAETVKHLSHDAEKDDAIVFDTEEEAQNYAERYLNWHWKVVKLTV